MKIQVYAKLVLVTCLAALAIGCGDSANEVIRPNPNQGGNPPVAPAAVYTMTNDGVSNAIREFRRNANGSLTFVADYPTGGSGSGGGLDASSNSLTFDAGNNRFYAVNAGSNSVTAMVLGTDGVLSPLSTVNSGGVRPISVTAFGDLIYVLNAGDANANQAANISGFRLVGSQLQAIPNSIQALSAANPNPAQIQFTPSGTVLAVTERATNNISTFLVASDGSAEPAQAQASNGNGPFGFDFTPGGILVVSEGAASAVSSYTLGISGAITSISNSIANGQVAACWVEISRNGALAYVSNTGSDNISIYNIDGAGTLTLQGNGNSASTGVDPVDLAISNDGLFLYVLNSGDNSISAFSIDGAGNLSPITGIGGLPANSVGLVAR